MRVPLRVSVSALQVLVELVLALQEELVQLHLLLAHALKGADNLLLAGLCSPLGLGGGAPGERERGVRDGGRRRE